MRYVSTLFLNIFTLLAVTQSVDNLFHSFIVKGVGSRAVSSFLSGEKQNVDAAVLHRFSRYPKFLQYLLSRAFVNTERFTHI